MRGELASISRVKEKSTYDYPSRLLSASGPVKASLNNCKLLNVSALFKKTKGLSVLLELFAKIFYSSFTREILNMQKCQF
ncbi:hypothetical protein T07_8710 [Trichinella nelsoni]|uniref:Uncharacterized protein n=1 Tax=Trichinella nelsoni TaxID=6336 RepID=A0A0V0SIT7_9BILA|nr:hypothetical protein T07_8710 [Trichinella nelsoni]